MHMLERSSKVRRVAGGDESADFIGAEQIGTRLKTFFDGVTTSCPMPDRLIELADALEAALERGDLDQRSGRALRA